MRTTNSNLKAHHMWSHGPTSSMVQQPINSGDSARRAQSRPTATHPTRPHGGGAALVLRSERGIGDKPRTPRHRTGMGAMGIVVRACAPPAPAAAAPSRSREAAQAQRRSKPSRTGRVLVLGGTGRVGGSTATALSKLRPDLGILVGGRNR